MSQSGFMHDLRGADSTDEWFTPPEVFDALGIDFDLDPAAPPSGVPWIPANRHFSKADDGLTQPWTGRVWLNPPYGRETRRWLARLAEHGDGARGCGSHASFSAQSGMVDRAGLMPGGWRRRGLGRTQAPQAPIAADAELAPPLRAA
jgi:hypothetical protein